MSALCLFDLDEVAPVRAPAPPPPSAPVMRRRLAIVEQPALPLPPPAPVEPPTKADWRRMYQRRAERVSLTLVDDAPSLEVDFHEMTHGRCLAQQAVCPYRDCHHHLGAVRHFVDPEPGADDEGGPREFDFACVLAVARHFPKGLAPRYVAELLGTTESEVQAVEIYAVKSLQAALDTDGEQADALWEAKAALDELDELDAMAAPEE